MNHFYMLPITNMWTVRMSEVMLDKFNIVKTCTSENYAQNWTENLKYYRFIDFVSLTVQNETSKGK